jgi:Uncharacterized protein conserved in bacteria
MLYAILCYNEENAVSQWTAEEDAACMERLGAVQAKMSAKGKLGPVVRLWNTDEAKTLRKVNGDAVVLDGPFAETKEQFLGFYVADCADMDEALAFAGELAKANPGLGCYEIRPLRYFGDNQLSGAPQVQAAE